MFLWRAELGEHWADCQTLLTTTPELAAWTLASDGVTPCDVIQHRDGSMVGINRVAGEAFAVNRDAQIVCKLNLRSLAAKITETLEGRIDFNLNSPNANVHRIGRLPPKLASAAMHLCVRGNDEPLLATASSLASSIFVVVLVPTLLHTSINVDALATQFKAIIVALDELIVDRDGRWHCQQHMLDELRNRLGIGETADVNSFRLEGENYHIRYAGRLFTLSNSVGLWYLRELLSHPNQVFDPVELETARTGVRGRSSNSSTGESFDAEAKREYARKLREIDEELEEAAQFNDLASIERLQSEREKLIDHISKATGKGGKARVTTDTSRARKNIRQQVNRDIDRISKFCPELADHLRTAFQGESLCYRPTQDPGWQF
jgi:hypothetical protein